MKPICYVVRAAAPSRELGVLSGTLGDHINSCLSCQAEMARYGKLQRHLAALADEVVEAPEPLAGAVAAAITSGTPAPDQDRGIAHPGRVAAAAGAVVAAAAGAVAVAAWRHSKLAVR